VGGREVGREERTDREEVREGGRDGGRERESIDGESQLMEGVNCMTSLF